MEILGADEVAQIAADEAERIVLRRYFRKLGGAFAGYPRWLRRSLIGVLALGLVVLGMGLEALLTPTAMTVQIITR